MKRVVYTPCGTAVGFRKGYLKEADESFRSDIDYIIAVKPFGGSYMISETLTERATLEFWEKHRLDVVTVMPSFIVGPFISRYGKYRWALAMLTGKYNLS